MMPINVSSEIKRRIDNYITDIPEYDDEELEEEDIDYLLDLEFESFRESELEYQNSLGEEKWNIQMISKERKRW